MRVLAKPLAKCQKQVVTSNANVVQVFLLNPHLNRQNNLQNHHLQTQKEFDYLRLGFVRTIPAIKFSVIDPFDWNLFSTSAKEPFTT